MLVQAYYLKYKNKRAEYIAAFWHVVDWQVVATRYVLATGEVVPDAAPSQEQRQKETALCAADTHTEVMVE